MISFKTNQLRVYQKKKQIACFLWADFGMHTSEYADNAFWQNIGS
jgi:hypothetical protein